MARGRSIIHVDMDAFFVSVELLRRPELRGRPVIVGGSGPRGVVAAASYESRSFGVRSAMPSVRARRLCPHAVFIDGDHAHYRTISAAVMAIFGSFTPLVEPLSLDEAFLDVSGARQLHGDGARIADLIRRRVYDEQGLRCSAGVAPNKFLAKLATEAAKPRASRQGPVPGLGVKVVAPDEVRSFLHPLPIGALWGVGPATEQRLRRLGVGTVADLTRLDERTVAQVVGQASARHLCALARGEDDRPVESERIVKSISHEETFPTDLSDRDRLQVEIVRLADGVARRLRAQGVQARTITLKLRFGDFETITRARTRPSPTDSGPDIARDVRELFEVADPGVGVRLLGVAASGLVVEDVRQLSLDDVGLDGWDEANEAIDAIRARFGADAIGPASLASGRGVRVKQVGVQQWGPGSAPVVTPAEPAEPASP